MAARAVGESTALCPRREGAVGDETAARSRDPHAGVAAAEGRIRRQLRLSPRAESGRAGTRGWARLSRRRARRACPVAAVQATSVAARAARRWRNDRVGAKTIPEGGFYSLPERRSGAGVVLLGDTAGFVDVPSLKGIHYAVQSGMYAARAIFQNLKNGSALTEYDRLVNASYVARDLHRTRNMRLAFRDGFYLGGFQAALM